VLLLGVIYTAIAAMWRRRQARRAPE
jgi:hypothetical protein